MIAKVHRVGINRNTMRTVVIDCRRQTKIVAAAAVVIDNVKAADDQKIVYHVIVNVQSMIDTIQEVDIDHHQVNIAIDQEIVNDKNTLSSFFNFLYF